MGRKKIQISRIGDERNRQVTFTKRKFGLMKKAYELSVLCDCEIALIIFNSANKLFQYASTDMDKVLLKYTEYNEPHESRTNKDIIEALNKKEATGKDVDSPDDSNEGYALTPRTQQRYEQINKEFASAMHMGSTRPGSGLDRLSPGAGPQYPGLQGIQPVHSPSSFQPPRSPHHNLSSAPPSLSPRPSSTSSGHMLDVGHTGDFNRGNITSPSNVSPSGHIPQPPRSPQSRIPPPSRGHPNLTVVIPNSRGEMPSSADHLAQMQSRIGNLATPIVAMTTPNVPIAFPTGLPSSFQGSGGGDFNLSTADLQNMAANYAGSPHNGWSPSGHPGGGGAHGPLTAAVNASGIPPQSLHSPNSGALSLTVNSSSHRPSSVKSEPMSPSQSHLRPPSSGLPSSPHSIHSHQSPVPSPVPPEYDGSISNKRPRMDSAWNPV
ncbi:myocyte-specific enhancer factor 2C-like isoform X2 [Watersipora subatra]|uniref:myocyte-specific enhancer factor 2C-like isoform X2 n=1 Tax=Watersipora subatra TaxID=2589382 RepID=UPI00355B875D